MIYQIFTIPWILGRNQEEIFISWFKKKSFISGEMLHVISGQNKIAKLFVYNMHSYIILTPNFGLKNSHVYYALTL